MKILMISQGLPFPVYRDGLTLRVYHLLKELSRRAQCDFVGFGEYELDMFEMAELHALAGHVCVVPYKSARGPAASARKLLSPRRYYARAFKEQIDQAICKAKPDVVLCEQTFMAQYVDSLGELPKVMSAVDAISLAAIRQGQTKESAVARAVWRYIARQRLSVEQKYFPKFDEVTVVSQEDADFLSERVSSSITVIPNGVDTDFFSPCLLDETRNSIVYTGNLSAPMNEEAAIYLATSVYPAIHAARPDIPLVIAGRGMTDAIRQAAPAYVLLASDLEDIRTVLRKALVYVSPVLYGTGIKNNVLQAMSMGIAVVTTDLIAKPIQMMNDDTGYIAERGTQFSTLLLELVANPSRCREVGLAGRRHVLTHYSWPSIADRYMAVFENAIARHTAGLKC